MSRIRHTSLRKHSQYFIKILHFENNQKQPWLFKNKKRKRKTFFCGDIYTINSSQFPQEPLIIPDENEIIKFIKNYRIILLKIVDEEPH